MPPCPSPYLDPRCNTTLCPHPWPPPTPPNHYEQILRPGISPPSNLAPTRRRLRRLRRLGNRSPRKPDCMKSRGPVCFSRRTPRPSSPAHWVRAREAGRTAAKSPGAFWSKGLELESWLRPFQRHRLPQRPIPRSTSRPGRSRSTEANFNRLSSGGTKCAVTTERPSRARPDAL